MSQKLFFLNAVQNVRTLTKLKYNLITKYIKK